MCYEIAKQKLTLLANIYGFSWPIES